MKNTKYKLRTKLLTVKERESALSLEMIRQMPTTLLCIFNKGNQKRFSQISNISAELSFDAIFPSMSSNSITLKPLYFEVPQTEEVSSFLYRDWIFQENKQDFIHSLAAQLCQAPQLTEYRGFLLRDDSCQNLLSIEACIEDPDRAFQKGILEPLGNHVKYPAAPSILVIDSVPESEGPSRSISSFLASYINQFPPWLKIVMSVNSDDVNIVSSLPFHRINLDCAMVKVRDDLLRYINCRINSGITLKANVSACRDEKQISRFAEHLAKSEHATFLFVKLILDLLQQNHLVIKSSSFKVIPVSLDEVFTLMFSLRFPSTATFSKVRPILEICLASIRPLTAIEIFYSLESASLTPSFSWSDFTQILRTLSGILIQRTDETLMLSHPALRSWLLKTNRFCCNIRSGHSYLALLPMRLRYPFATDKELEFVYHLSRSNLFENDECLRALLVHHSSITPLNLLRAPQVLAWTDEQIHAQDKVGRCALSAAAEKGSFHVVVLLAESKNWPSGILRSQAIQRALIAASGNSNFHICEYLIKIRDSVSQEKMSCFKAAARGYLPVLKVLADKNFPLDMRDKSGRIALMWACIYGKIDAVRFLLERGADISIKDMDLCTSLHMAAMYADSHLVSLLLSKTADFEVKNKEYRTPLECAISVRNISTTLGLLKGGVAIGSGAFECSYGHARLYSLLLDKLLSDGVSLYEKGHFIEANHRFEYAMSKAILVKISNKFEIVYKKDFTFAKLR
ncbi:protein TANC2 [Caerostris extrusa]|uniref:Protein TANC2 n=1 Tax=Caerostris extrusa TaxID=172846 RepID=A0AAV4T2L5_CAEEX|nr:protein TANC2 [Caerostris extrusa]